MKAWRRVQADATLLVVAVIWGSAFVYQSTATQYLGVFLFNGLRFLLGGLVLLPLLRFRLRLDRQGWSKVILAGLLLIVASALQQAGLYTTTAANAGFITSLYVVLVPVLLWLGWRQKISRWNWLAAGLAILGTLILSTGGRFKPALGDSLELAGAFLWALHVIVVGQAMQHIEVLPFAIGQYLVAGAGNLALGLILDYHTLPGLAHAWLNVVYVGLLSTALGYTLQAAGQRVAPAADAAILLSMEAVFAAVFGFLFLDERLLLVQLSGCGLILAAVVLTQVKPR